MRTLVVAYGNIDRQDDGAAWHILTRLLERMNHFGIDPFEQPQIEPTPNLTCLFALQLTPEMAELISKYERVCFIDAHTGAAPEPLYIDRVRPEFISSPLTHHLTPAACLYLVETIYRQQVEGILVSVQGFEFGFGRSLSARTAVLADQAVESILGWIVI